MSGIIVKNIHTLVDIDEQEVYRNANRMVRELQERRG